MKIVFFTPHYRDGLGYGFYWESKARTLWPKGAQVTFFDPVGMTTPGACNEAVNVARTVGADWLVVTAFDVAWKPDTIIRLMAHDKDVVGSICMSQYWPHRWHAMVDYREDECAWGMVANRQRGLQRVDGIGGGFWLMKVSVFDRVEEPWFEFKTVDKKRTHPEDLSFSRKALAAGVELYVDWETPIAHSASGWYSWADGCLVSQAELRKILWGNGNSTGGGRIELSDARDPEVQRGVMENAVLFAEMKRNMAKMTDSQRVALMDGFCDVCGRDTRGQEGICECWKQTTTEDEEEESK